MCTLQFIYTLCIFTAFSLPKSIRSFVGIHQDRSFTYTVVCCLVLARSAFSLFQLRYCSYVVICDQWLKESGGAMKHSLIVLWTACNKPLKKNNNNNNKSLMLEFKAITFYWENLCECVLVRFNLKLLCTLIVVLLSALFQVKHCF